jgi:hypothetical protein
LSVAPEFDAFSPKLKNKVKSDGQECPSYTDLNG